MTSAKLKDNVSGANTPGWFRTVLELDRRSFHHWPSELQGKEHSFRRDKSTVINLGPDWDGLVTGSLDVFIKSVVASPSFLSADAGYAYSIIPSIMLII